MTLRIAVVACGIALLVGVVVATVTLTGSGGLPVVTTVPASIPPGGVALWQADQHGRPTGLGAYLHRPRSPDQNMSQGPAEEAALLINSTPWFPNPRRLDCHTRFPPPLRNAPGL
jgi:hypothetical protein